MILQILLLYYLDRLSTMAKDYAVVMFTQDGNNEQEIVSEVPRLPSHSHSKAGGHQ